MLVCLKNVEFCEQRLSGFARAELYFTLSCAMV
jgi:hypothetical protein